MYRLSQWLVQPVQKCPCWSCSDIIQIIQRNDTVILLPQSLWLSGACPEQVGTKLHRPWDIWALSEELQELWNWAQEEPEWFSLPPRLDSHWEVCGAVLDWGAWMSLLIFLRNITVLLQSSGVCGCHLAYTCAFVLLTICFVKSFFQMS